MSILFTIIVLNATYDEEEIGDTNITCLSGSETSSVANNLEKRNNRGFTHTDDMDFEMSMSKDR